MRKAFFALLSGVLVLPFGLAVSPAGGAQSVGICTETGSETETPALPLPGDPTLVTPQFTTTLTLTGCVGLGVTGGTATFTAVAQTPENCDSLNAGTAVAVAPGTTVYTWNTGQTSTDLSSTGGGIPIGSGQVTGGLFQGAARNATIIPSSISVSPGFCSSTGVLMASFSGTLALLLPPGLTTCASPQPCNAVKSATATATAPGLFAAVTGTPAGGAGTLGLTVAKGRLLCPKFVSTVAPVATLTDTGFAPTDRLNVTATVPLASSTSAEEVCFNSTVPFMSQSSPTVAKAGTAFLLDCTQVGDVAPCVTSSTQVGSNAVVKLVVPGGDAHFDVVSAKGLQVWALKFAPGTVGRAYSVHLETRGGKAPVHWKIASGTLPNGCTLDPNTGAITGTPTKRGSFTALVQATDSRKPSQNAKLSLAFTVK